VYWVRRLVVVGLPLLVIIVLVIATTGGSSKPPRTTSNGAPNPQQTAQTSGGGACTTDQLSAVLSASESIYQVGQEPVFTATISNVSPVTCQLTTSPSNEEWTVTSGAAQWWTTKGCPQPDTSARRALKAGASRQVSITWDGHRLDPGCKRGEPAQPGTYHLSATIDGVNAEEVAFHFTKKTQ
jgi:hypothetical protein